MISGVERKKEKVVIAAARVQREGERQAALWVAGDTMERDNGDGCSGHEMLSRRRG